MKSISKTAVKCNRIPASPSNNVTAPATSILNESVSDGSGDKWLKFNPEVAQKTDIVFATLCYGIYLWIKTPAKKIFKKPTIEGKPAAFRSGRQLESEYPWWDHSTILNAIERGEKALKGQLFVDRERRPLHFAMGAKMMKMHKSTTGFLGFLKSDAIKYGVWPAVFLANLKHQMAAFTDPLKDDEGNKYGELSPTKLTEVRADHIGNMRPILPIKYDRAVDVIASLKKTGAIVSHPTRKGFYRVPNEGEMVGNRAKRSVGKLDMVMGKLDKTVGKLDRVCEVNIHNTRNNNHMHSISETLDSNVDSNSNRKCFNTPTSPLRYNVEVPDSSLSPGAKKLISLINDDLAQQKPILPFDINQHAVFEVIDEDNTRLIGYDLFYDWLPVDPRTGELYSRAREIDDAMIQLKTIFKDKGWKYTQNEMVDLRGIFQAHPSLTCKNVADLVFFTSPQTNPTIIEDTPKRNEYDWCYFARRIRSLKQFLRYLPRLVREYYMAELSDQTDFECGEDGMPICEFQEMPSPFLDLAFDRENLEWNDSSLITPTTYRREGDFIITTHGFYGDVITFKKPIDN